METSNKQSRINVAGVIILYNPDQRVLGNIDACLRQVELLFIIDNSSTENIRLREMYSGKAAAEYIFNNGNIGIAAALNLGALKALQKGFTHILTMDQDSLIPDGMVKELINIQMFYPKAAMIAPYHVNPVHNKLPADSNVHEAATVMTSGSLLNLEAYEKAGGFMEKLFIDYVDHEYCLRLIGCGYLVLQVNSLHMTHNLGSVTVCKVFAKEIYPTNHSPLRLYYRTRNRLLVRKLYGKMHPDYIKQDNKDFLVELFKIIVFEKQKMDKIRMILKGIIHYRRGLFGKYLTNGNIG